LAQTRGTLRLPGLHAPVEVLRDRWGVPHIYGRGIHDLLFAQGFVHAQDRLWQMEFNRRLVAGRLSEVVGQATAPVDCWMRILGMRRAAEAGLGLLRGDIRAELDAYVAGINAFIGRGKLPIEFTLLRYQPEPWAIADSLAWAKMMSWTLSVNWESEILRAQLIARLGPAHAAELEGGWLPDWPTILPAEWRAFSEIGRAALARAEAARPFVGPAPQDGVGSNNWVIAGARTFTHKPLLANDMHLLMAIPSIWYENHLVVQTDAPSTGSEGELDVTGVTFPGIPYVVAGHNAHVAWGFTNGFPDVQDLYMEHLRRSDDGQVQYEFQGEWRAAQVRREEVRVKGAAPITQEVVSTRHGPIINVLAPDFIGEQPLALRWTSSEPDTLVHAIWGMNRARSCGEFREALRDWAAPAQNTVYADTAGHIGYSFPGKVPIRAKGDGSVPVPGWTGEYEWVGYVPFEELPHLYDPPAGYIVTANNRVAGADYPYFIGHEFCMGDRAQRITELIEARDKINVAYVRRMHFDLVSPTARAIADHISGLVCDDAELMTVAKMMTGWDGDLAADSPQAAIYEVFMRRCIALLLRDKLGADLAARYAGKGPTPGLAGSSFFGQRSWEWLQKTLATPDSHWFDLGHGERRDDIISLALRETVDFLKERLGPASSDWAWGKLHQIRFSHTMGQVAALAPLFNRGPFPLGGDGNTIWATGSGMAALGSDQVVGPPFRLIADLADWRDSSGLLAPGNSGQPGSRHYDDQIGAWFTGEYHPLLFTRGDVEREAVGRLTLMPR
jgi:penicillin amidase